MPVCNLLNLPSNPVHCYADDSTLHNTPTSHKDRVDIAFSINLDLCRLTDWGFQNLVNFNAVKTQCCLISRSIETSATYHSILIHWNSAIKFQCWAQGSDLSWKDHISTTAKAAACKLGLLFRSRRYFTPSSLLTLYKAQIRPCLEYGSHL